MFLVCVYMENLCFFFNFFVEELKDMSRNWMWIKCKFHLTAMQFEPIERRQGVKSNLTFAKEAQIPYGEYKSVVDRLQKQFLD